MTARCYWAFTLQSRSCPFPYRVSKRFVFWHDRCAMLCSLQLEIMFFFSLSLFASYSLLKATMPANILISWCFWCLWTRSILDRQMYVKTGWCASSVRRVVCVWSGSSEERNKYLRKPRQVIFSSSLKSQHADSSSKNPRKGYHRHTFRQWKRLCSLWFSHSTVPKACHERVPFIFLQHRFSFLFPAFHEFSFHWLRYAHKRNWLVFYWNRFHARLNARESI